MAQPGQISSRQAVMLLFLCRIFSTMVFVSKRMSVDGSTALLGAALAVFLQLLAVLPLCILLKKMGSKDIITCAWEMSPALGKVSAILVWGIAIMNGIAVSCQLDIFLVSTLFPRHPEVVILFLFGLAIFYGAWMGLEACARFAAGIFLSYLLVTLLVGIRLFPQYELLNVRSPLAQGWGKVFQSAFAFLLYQSETAAVLMLAPRVKGRLFKSYTALVVLTAVGVGAITFLTLAVLGEYARTQPYPVYTLFTMADLFSLERTDSLYMVLWILIAFLKGALALFLAQESIGILFPEQYRPFLRVGNLILVLGISLLLIFQVRDMELVGGIRASAYPSLLVGVLLPCLVLGVGHWKKRCGKAEKQ